MDVAYEEEPKILPQIRPFSSPPEISHVSGITLRNFLLQDLPPLPKIPVPYQED